MSQRSFAWLRHWAFAALALVAILVLIERVRLLSTPLERDEGEYACAGQLILRGHAPYTLCYNMKLPGTYVAYAGIMAVFGQTDVAIHFGAMLVNFCGVFLLYRLARRFLNATGASVAAATHCLLTVSPSVAGLAAHATQFVIVPALGGLLALCRAFESERKINFFWSGLLFGVAFVMKQPGIVFGLFGLGVLFWRFARSGSVLLSRSNFAKTGCYASGLAAPLAVVVLWIWRAGALERFWFWTFTYARSYGDQTSFHDALTRLGEYFFRLSDRWLWMAAVVAVVLVFATKKPGRWLALVFLAFSFAAVAAGWRFSNHYFILLTPAAALFLGGAFESGSQGAASIWRFLASIGFFALCATIPCRHPVILLRSNPEQLVARYYAGNPFVECREIGRYLEAHSAPSDTIAVLGSEPEIFFYAHRQPASGYIYMYDLTMLQPHAAEMQKEMISQIERAHPKFLVFVRDNPSWIAFPGAPRASDAELRQWAGVYTASNYAPAGLVLVRPQSEYFWGSDAFKRTPVEPFVSILQRKS